MSERPYWVSIAEPLSVELYEYWGSDVLMIACLERELEKAYKAGVDKGRELAGERQALRGQVAAYYSENCRVNVHCNGRLFPLWGAKDDKVSVSGNYLRAMFHVNPDDDLWHSCNESRIVPENDTYFFIDNGAEFYTAGKQINDN